MGQALGGFITGWVCAFGICLALSVSDNAQKRLAWEAEAVRHGAARWTVDEAGRRVFEWVGKEKGEHDDGR